MLPRRCSPLSKCTALLLPVPALLFLFFSFFFAQGSDRCLDLVEQMPKGGIQTVTDWSDFYKNGTMIRVADCNDAYDQQWRLAGEAERVVCCPSLVLRWPAGWCPLLSFVRMQTM